MNWYKYDIRNLSDAEYLKWYQLMNKEKQVSIDKMRILDDKKRSVAGEMLTKCSIAKLCGVKAEDIIFSKGINGKPFALNMEIEFNISHSSDIVVCAVNDTAIGIDIERIRPVDLKISKRICTEKELFYIFCKKPTESDFVYTEENEILKRFFEIWTAKEANAKRIGSGIKDIRSTPERDKIKHFYFEDYIVSIAF